MTRDNTHHATSPEAPLWEGEDPSPSSRTGPPQKERRQRKSVKNSRALGKPAERSKTSVTPEQKLLLLDTWKRSGLPGSDFAELVGFSSKTLYQWRRALEKDGAEGLFGKPRGPKPGSRVPPVTRKAILLIKEEHPEYGCERISQLLYRGPGLGVSPASRPRSGVFSTNTASNFCGLRSYPLGTMALWNSATGSGQPVEELGRREGERVRCWQGLTTESAEIVAIGHIEAVDGGKRSQRRSEPPAVERFFRQAVIRLSHWRALRKGRGSCWSCEDVREARLIAGTLRRSKNLSRRQVFDARPAISNRERSLFRRLARDLRPQTYQEVFYNLDPDEISAVQKRALEAKAERLALQRALVQSGLLFFRSRRITPAIPAGFCAIIS